MTLITTAHTRAIQDYSGRPVHEETTYTVVVTHTRQADATLLRSHSWDRVDATNRPVAAPDIFQVVQAWCDR